MKTSPQNSESIRAEQLHYAQNRDNTVYNSTLRFVNAIYSKYPAVETPEPVAQPITQSSTSEMPVEATVMTDPTMVRHMAMNAVERTAQDQNTLQELQRIAKREAA